MSISKEDMKKEYDLRALGQGVRGKYFERYQNSTNVVVIDPELSKTFPNTKAVNEALRLLLNKKKAVSS